MAGILEGIRVIEVGTGAAAAITAMLLADHGAEVVRITPPGEEVLRQGGFIVWDRGKRCLQLDIDAAAGASSGASKVWQRLVAGADILIEDVAPSSPLQRLVSPDRLSGTNPRLIACSITAYGKRGPLRDEPPIDDLVLARTGVLGGMPGFRPAPVHVVHPLPSVGAALMACNGIAAALLAREKTGRGRAVETSLMAGALLYHPKVDGERIPRHVFQTHPAGSAPFYSNYECADGRYIQLGCVHPGFIATAARLMGISALVAEPRFDQGRGGKTPADVQEMRDTIARIMLTRPSAEWAADFEANDVPFAPCRLTEESLDDPQVVHNGMVTTLQDPAQGSVTQMGVAVAFGTTPGSVRPRPSTAEVLRDVPPGWPSSANARAPAPSRGPDPAPLAGVRILEITNLIAGPTCGRILADLGADVIKLEPPGGDLSRPIGRTYFYSVNFEKRSIAVDASNDTGRAVVQRIAAGADALVANVRPHATERMGIGLKHNPRMVETHLTGYGWTGPYSKRPGIDPLAQALMGLQRAQGGPENPPVFPAQLAPTDFTTGGLGAYGTILALYHRARTGVAQRVDVNLLTGGILLTSPWFTRYEARPERPLADKGQYGYSPFHRLFQVKDGWIYVVAGSDRERQALLTAAGIAASRLSEPPTPGVHPNESRLAQDLAAAFAGHTVAGARAALGAAGVPSAEAQPGDSELFLEDPHAIENEMVAIRPHPKAGRLRVAWHSIRLGNTNDTLGRPTPLLGEHTAEVMREIGYDAAAIAEHYAAGVVLTEKP